MTNGVFASVKFNVQTRTPNENGETENRPERHKPHQEAKNKNQEPKKQKYEIQSTKSKIQHDNSMFNLCGVQCNWKLPNFLSIAYDFFVFRFSIRDKVYNVICNCNYCTELIPNYGILQSCTCHQRLPIASHLHCTLHTHAHTAHAENAERPDIRNRT